MADLLALELDVVYCREQDSRSASRPRGGPTLQNTPGGNVGQGVERRAEEAVQEASPWVERLARFGYLTKGAVYIVVGVLAVGLATGMGVSATDPRGALVTIGEQPFGGVMLGFLTIGLAAYALWRIVQAVADPEGEGYDAKGIARRIGHGGAGLAYGGLALTAGRLLLGSSGGGSSPRGWTALLLSQPFG